MRKKILLSLFFALGLLAMESAFTSSSIPPSGHTGAPGEQTCARAGCHTGSSVVTNSSFLALTSSPSGLFTTGYTPGQTYNIIVNFSASAPRYGFEMTILDKVNNALAGNITITNPTTTELSTTGGRQYVSHENANSTNAWTFSWTAPAAGTDTVIFYVAGNAANNNFSSSGDVIHTNQFKLAQAAQQPVSGCTEIFISEYVEGSGFNKALELYNPTASPVDLSNYRLAQYNNGSSTPGVFSTLSGIIQPYGTRVLVIDKRTGGTVVDAALQAKADTFMNPTNTAEVMYFNGDDAIVLQRLNGTVVDIFGKIGQDPGTGWSSGTTLYTIDHTLVRKPTVTQGVTTSPTTFDPGDEWILYPNNFFDSLRTHTSVCSPTFCSTINLTATVAANVSCNGGSNGAVNLVTTGGTGVYTYNSTPTNNLAAGTYTYIVTDNFGCTDTTTVTITQPAVLSLNVTDRDLSCGVTNDGRAFAAASGGTTPYTFAWSGGTPNATGDTISALTAGTYTVTVTDANNCTATGTTQVTAPLQAQQPSSISGLAAACLGTSAYSVPAQAGVTFTWAVSSGGTITPTANLASIEWTATGTHTISVTASTPACGNAPVQTLQVSISAIPPTPTIAGDNTICLPATETYTATATGATTYNWSLASGGNLSPSGATATVVWATPGTHTLSVTATNSCGTSLVAGSLAVNVGNPTVSLGNDTTACGQVNLGVTGFPTVQWSTGATSNQVTITQTGTVGVTVTDNLGCQASDAVNVTITPGSTLNLPATASACDTATVQAPGSFVTYAWSNGQNTATGTFTQSGTYVLSVTDANGCNVTDDVVVTILPEPVPGIPATATGCDTAFVTASAFNAYAWSNGQTTQTGSFTAPGTYTITVTDANGCIGSATTTVTLNTDPVANFTFNANALTVAFTALGSPADSYAWDFGNGTTATDQNPTVTYAADGNYTVTLTVTNSCGSDVYTETVTVVSIGIDDLGGIGELEVFPSPTSSQLQVTWGNAQGTAILEVWNTLGQRLSTMETPASLGQQVLTVQDLASGMYLLRLQIGGQSKMVKFVKE